MTPCTPSPSTPSNPAFCATSPWNSGYDGAREVWGSDEREEYRREQRRRIFGGSPTRKERRVEGGVVQERRRIRKEIDGRRERGREGEREKVKVRRSGDADETGEFTGKGVERILFPRVKKVGDGEPARKKVKTEAGKGRVIAPVPMEERRRRRVRVVRKIRDEELNDDDDDKDGDGAGHEDDEVVFSPE